MRVRHRIAAVVLAVLLPLSASACTRPPPDPLPQLPPYRTDLYTPIPVQTQTTPTSSPTPTPTQAPSASPVYPSVAATPIPGFPTATGLATVDAHVAAGSWGFITFPDTSGGTATNTAAIKVNGMWKGAAGSLGGQTPTTSSGVDMSTATPYFISWTYVVTTGDWQASPHDIVMPGDTGNVYEVSSPFTDRDCPDYTPSVRRGVGVDVLQCTVVVSSDAGVPASLVFEVPAQAKHFWFFDVPKAKARPS